MNRSELLYQSADVRVCRFDHPPHETHHDPDAELAQDWAISFVRAGSFDISVDGERLALRAGGVFIARPGLEFSCAHGVECPDDVCISVRFEPHAVADFDDAWERAGWTTRNSSTPRLAYVNTRLLAATDAVRDSTRGAYSARNSDVAAVVATCRDIEADPTARRSIAERARAVGVTGTQLTHFFRRYLGVSPHQFVIRWRLAAAAELLEGGASVSESCYRAGFENLSHFCRTFQRIFGIRASQWRHGSLRERRRKVQALTSQRV